LSWRPAEPREARSEDKLHDPAIHVSVLRKALKWMAGSKAGHDGVVWGSYETYNHPMDEFGIIARYFAPLAGEGAFGLTDDAALLPSRAGHELIVTTDTISEGTDFFAFDPADTVAQKALRVNLSDLAAKGAEPAGYLLNLTLPHTVTEGWLAAFASGLGRDQAEFGLSLLGGDTGAGEGPLSIAITAFGFVPAGRMVRRSGAKPGDAVYVTGTIGDSGGGLAIFKREKHTLSDSDRDHLIGRYRLPQPPVGFASRLRDVAHASVDISDGLIADLGHIASASGVRIVVEGMQVPLSRPLKAFWGEDALLRAVTAGDDYQIAFTGPADLSGPFTRIGRVEAGEGVNLVIDGHAAGISLTGYQHF
jgi:thiamine-monophosphate kinase